MIAGVDHMDGRHHRVNREIIFVPVPVAGSPAPLNQAKPAKYPSTRRAPWRPQQTIPSKASATVRLLDAIVRNEQAARNMLRPLPPSAMLTRSPA
jgi:hypothetical protein